jgi:hypothetical protein
MKTLNQLKTFIIQHSQYPTWPPMLMIFVFTLFLTSCEEKDEEVLPTLNTITASDADITSTTALLKGEVLDLGNMRLLEYGIELSKNQIFYPSTKGTINGAPAPGTYEITFTGLTPNTKYYYKAYVLINTADYYSPNVENFTTKP